MAGSHAGRALALAALVALGPGIARVGAQPPSEPPAAASARRERLERLAGVVQRRLGLTDAQTERLQTTTARYGRERQALLVAERQARRTLRSEVSRGDAADQARVRTALDALVSAQQLRATLLADEQRALAAFLSPVQRARYLGLQERAFRAAQRLRQGRSGLGDSADRAEPNEFRRPRRPL